MNYYQLLDISPHSTREEIIQAYERKSRFSNDTGLKELKRAYLILLDPRERIRYDNELASQTSTATHTSSQSSQHAEQVESTPSLSVSELEKLNYYARLNIHKTADRVTIKKAYAKAARTYSNEQHPDHFILIREAFETLYDEDSRQDYDDFLTEGSSYQHDSQSSKPDQVAASSSSNYSSSHSSSYSAPSSSDSEGSSRPFWGFLVAIIGSFIFTPIIAVPLGLVIGMGLSDAISFVVRSLSSIVGIILFILLLFFIFG